MYDILIKKLDEFIRKYYLNQLIKGAIYSGAIFFTALLFFAVIEYFGHFGSLVRAVLFYTFLGLLVFTLARWIVIPFLKLRRMGKVISYEEASAIIGNHFGEVRDKLLNVLQLKHASARYGGQQELLEASIDQKIKELKPVPFQFAVDLKANRKYLKYLLFPAAIVLIMGVSLPEILWRPSERIIRYADDFEPKAPFDFLLQNKELSAIKNEDYEITLQVRGEVLPAETYIENNGRKVRLDKEGKTTFKHVFRNMQENTTFRFFADGFYSKPYTIQVLPNPLLLSFEVMLDYPDYLDIESETIENIGDLEVPEGTKVTWSMLTENTDKLVFAMEGEEIEVQRSGEDHYTYSWVVDRSLRYAMHTSNKFHKNSDSIRYNIEMIRDEAPSISVTSEKDSAALHAVHFAGRISDDHGLRTLSFNYRKVAGEEAQGKFQSVPLTFNKALLQTDYYYYLAADALGFAPGEEVQYYFEVSDNDGVNGSKFSRTPMNRFRLASKKEMKEDVEQQTEQVKEELAEAMKEAKEIKKELSELSRKLIDKKDAGWQDKEQFRSLMEKQRSLKEKVKNIEERFEKKNELSREISPENEEILEKQRQMEELLEELMTDEMKATMEEISSLLEKMDKEKLEEEVEKMELSSEDLEKELDRSLELLKQLEFEQKLQETMDELNALKESQEDLQKKTEEGKKEEVKENAGKQEELNKDFEEIRKELSELEKKNSEMEFPNKMEPTEEMEQKISENMKEGLENMKNGKQNKAGEKQKEAAEGMEELSETLAGMQMQMMNKQAKDLNALRQLLDNVLTSSFEQEALMERLEGISSNDPNYVSSMVDQKKIRDNIKMVEDSLFALSKRVPQIKAVVNKEINSINNNIDKAIKEMQERKTPMARSRQQLAMTSLNNLGLLLDEVVQQMQQQMAMKMPGKGSCDKPGGQGQPKPNPGSMGDMQKALNDQLKQMREAMDKKGGTPGAKGSDGKDGEMSKELARMAARQAALREELRKMAGGKESGDQRGEMKKLSELMEQTETDIVNKQITRETLRRQEEILTRLLESEKAEREREWDNKRKSEEFTDEIKRNEKNFLEYYKKSQKEVELLRTMIPSYNEFYKKKVAEYFKSISE